MRVTPGEESPQSDMPESGQEQAESGQGGPAEQSVQMIQQGFSSLAEIFQQAGDRIDPADMQLFQAAAQATDALIQSLTSPMEGQGGQQQSQSPGGPMSENDKANGSGQPTQY